MLYIFPKGLSVNKDGFGMTCSHAGRPLLHSVLSEIDP